MGDPLSPKTGTLARDDADAAGDSADAMAVGATGGDTTRRARAGGGGRTGGGEGVGAADATSSTMGAVAADVALAAGTVAMLSGLLPFAAVIASSGGLATEDC
jgi:hypothetical protein